jgi:hypothetical protein
MGAVDRIDWRALLIAAGRWRPCSGQNAESVRYPGASAGLAEQPVRHRCYLTDAVEDDIPIMLIDEATSF